MSHFTNSTTQRGGDHVEHIHQHAQPTADVWKDDEYDSSISRSHPTTGLPGHYAGISEPSTHSPSTATSGATGGVIYTEKVTKELDAQGNVIQQHVEHPKAGSIGSEFDDTQSHGLSTASGAQGASSTTARGRQPMVSDDYGRLGANRARNEGPDFASNAAREKKGKGFKSSF